MKAVEFKDVSERYRIKFVRGGKVSWEEVWVLRDINLSVEKGSVLGVIGQNGAGKTTLLKLIAGMLMPDRGRVDVDGRVSALMELGAGFNPEFTGRENIMLNARMYGWNEARLEGIMGGIAEFADLGRFIDAPVKYYSQGMYMRLAFALAIFVAPDILLIDDILAVGDQEAQEKCIKKILELKKEDKTIILVSHDMNMVSKLCDKAILLENGKIIQDGLPQKVISSYLETAGRKEGIAIIEKKGYRVVFNNGRIYLSCNGLPVTKGMGGYAAFFDASINNWNTSYNLYWQIGDCTPDTITAQGRSLKDALRQDWTIDLKDKELRWRVRAKEKDMKRLHIDLIVGPQYSRWIALNGNGAFPLFSHKYNWQDLGLGDLPEGIIGIDPGEETGDLPFIIAEKQNAQIKLFNTGYEDEGRVFQCNLDKADPISIKFFSDKDSFDDYMKNIQRGFLLKEEKRRGLLRREEEKGKEDLQFRQEAERKRVFAQRTLSNGDLRLFCDLDNKTIRLYCKDREITAGNGLNNSFYVSGRWFNLGDAEWNIEKVSDEKLILNLDYRPLPLSATWHLSCSRDILDIKVDMKLDKPISIINLDTRLGLQNVYKDWKSAGEEGGLSVNRYINDIGPIRLKDNRVSQIILTPNSNDFSKLFFEATSHPDEIIASIYRRKETREEPLYLNFSLIVPKRDETIQPGNYSYFTGRVVLNRDVKFGEKSFLNKSIKINKSDLKFVFELGRGRIFWKDKELTTGLGIYTSVNSSGIWYDSYRAAWKVQKRTDTGIIASGDWPHLPISQVWQMELADENLILWNAEMKIHREVALEIEQVNLMLSPEYGRWAIPKLQTGEFLNEYAQDYDISPFRFWYGKTDQAEAVSENLPRVVFKNELKKDYMRAIVENSDDLYRARLLQYQKANADILLPGKRLYFKGAIEIVPIP
ncbi:MAG: ABC transporter ATP-binding protein [Candidatus Omnitrophica bacterium]|nr:ABC transporter ATP-binding protein [Candidatus Omnitrophota bacterium]